MAVVGQVFPRLFRALLQQLLGFVLDTGLLPISAIVWGIKALVGGSDAKGEAASRRELEERRERRRREASEQIKTERAANEAPADTNE